MFFSSETVDHLKSDHDQLRSYLVVLLDQDSPLQKKRRAFASLLPILVSHSEREEMAVYSFMKKQNSELLEMALEGKTEHNIISELAEELKRKDISSALWAAKVKVFSELLKHHVDEEEREVFPKLKRAMDKRTDEKVCHKYDMGEQVTSANI